MHETPGGEVRNSQDAPSVTVQTGNGPRPLDDVLSDLGGDAGAPAWDDITDKPTFADVATSGAYADLSGTPSIPSQPSDIGAQPAGDYATTNELFSGSYDDLTGKPSIPTQPSDIGAQPAGDYATTSDLAAKADTADLAPIATSDAAKAAWVTNADASSLETLATAIDALRGSLVYAGLMDEA